MKFIQIQFKSHIQTVSLQNQTFLTIKDKVYKILP